MRKRKLLAAFALVKSITDYRLKKQNSSEFKNEKCENYYRCDDDENDGRGNY